MDNIIVIDNLSLYVFIVLIEENFNKIGLFLLDLNLMKIIIISVLVVVFIGIIVIFGFILIICYKR